MVICATIGQVAQPPDGGDGRANLVEIAEGFEHEELDAALEQRFGLFFEILLGLVDAGLAPRLDAHAERADGAGDKRVLAGNGARQAARRRG